MPYVAFRFTEGDGAHVAFSYLKGREHKPQFVPLLGATFFSGELRLGGLRGRLGREALVFLCKVRLHSCSLRGVAR
ncbi:hypothetical protein Taro_041169 [Colocasia esculenta]|uniref:Uncharacterized protein n=1 Tax=Colocasia esculenta TaxID=4460 RepID=A0A843WDN0_COLES|nr:hypothetical protein [Colocasia esculenta]